MKFLIDRCAGRRLAEWLRQVGHEVSHIVHRYEQGRQSPDEIVQAYPHLTLAQVHAALAFYYSHRELVDQEIASSDELLLRFKQAYPSKLSDHSKL